MKQIKTTAIVLFIFISGFITSQLFFTPQFTDHKRIESAAFSDIEERQALPTKQPIIALEDSSWYTNKIAQLEDELSNKSKELESLISDKNSKKSNEKVNELTSDRFSSMTIEETETILPKPYSDIVASTGGSMIDYLREHLKDDVDYDWASDIEQKIKDFVYLHPHSSGIELQSITCKASTCELMLIEFEDFTWDRIYREINRQDWFSFSAGSSSTIVDSKSYIYIMLSKT